MCSGRDSVEGAVTVAAQLENVRILAEWLRSRCAQAGIAEAEAFDLELAMVEAANNCIEHGYADNPQGMIGLDFIFAEGRAVVRLTDQGARIPERVLSECREVPFDAQEGRGIALVRSCVDEIEYRSENGLNCLELAKRIG